jgi:hypothetical protein
MRDLGKQEHAARPFGLLDRLVHIRLKLLRGRLMGHDGGETGRYGSYGGAQRLDDLLERLGRCVRCAFAVPVFVVGAGGFE